MSVTRTGYATSNATRFKRLTMRGRLTKQKVPLSSTAAKK